ncbi:RNA-binding S4 domain-containing protein [Curvivirga sp.]|uniref:RNA-binding S4 domain-containing protein n=1 Tax=Curvivirga sp. TaxID=2856848 RepID=UPI003B59026D
MIGDAPEKLRVDKWLWYARFFKTRTLAAQQVTSGHLRVNSQPVRKAGYQVKVGDILTFPKEQDIRVIEILALGDKRRGAPEAALLYNDLDPPVKRKKSEQATVDGLREQGAGRPTKKERRETDRLKSVF